jgi:hypothetical protein
MLTKWLLLIQSVSACLQILEESVIGSRKRAVLEVFNFSGC